MDTRTETMTATGMRERLIAKAAADETFRARLLSDPKAAVQDELGLAVPAGFTIEVHEDAVDTSHLVLPPPSMLEEADLDQVAGGREWWAGITIGWGDSDLSDI